MGTGPLVGVTIRVEFKSILVYSGSLKALDDDFKISRSMVIGVEPVSYEFILGESDRFFDEGPNSGRSAKSPTQRNTC